MEMAWYLGGRSDLTRSLFNRPKEVTGPVRLRGAGASDRPMLGEWLNSIPDERSQIFAIFQLRVLFGRVIRRMMTPHVAIVADHKIQ